ncbi:MAG: hypothetical protein IKH54_06615 [Bacilli bacterium]|nr:hypothetical protein [Bacilli bacterium]
MGKVIDFNCDNVIYNMALKSFSNDNSTMQKKILNYTNKKEFGVDFIYNLAEASDFLYELETMISNKEFLKNISFYYMALVNYGNYVEKNNGLSGSIDRDFLIDIKIDKGIIKYSCRNLDNYEKGYLKFFANKYFINYKNGNYNKMIDLFHNRSIHNDSTVSYSSFFNYDNSKLALKSIERNSNYSYKNNKKEFIPSSDENNVVEMKRFNKVNNFIIYNHTLNYLNNDYKLINNKNNYYYGYDYSDKFDVSKICFNEIDDNIYKTLKKRK